MFDHPPLSLIFHSNFFNLEILFSKYLSFSIRDDHNDPCHQTTHHPPKGQSGPYPLFLSAVIAIASKVYSTILLHLLHQDCIKSVLNHTTTFHTLHNYICYFQPSRLYQWLTNLLSTWYCTLFGGFRSSHVGLMCCTDTLCAVETKMLDKCKLQEAATTASKRELPLKCNF